MRCGQARRRDAAEKPIRDALDSVGVKYWQISCKGGPDLLVKFMDRFYAGEVKSEKGTLTENQGEFPVWRTPEDALRCIGLVVNGIKAREVRKTGLLTPQERLSRS